MHAVFKRELGCTPREYQEQFVAGLEHSAAPAPRQKKKTAGNAFLTSTK